MRRNILLAILSLIASVALRGASLKLVQPNGGTLSLGQQNYPIRWTAVGVSEKVKLILFKDGVRLGRIAADLDAAAPSYSWTVGQWGSGMAAAGTGYKVCVRTMSDSLEDFSDAPFSLKESGFPHPPHGFPKPGSGQAPALPGTVRPDAGLLKIDVTFPREGTHIHYTEKLIVMWETAIPGPFAIDLMSADGKTQITPLCENVGNNVGGSKWVVGNILLQPHYSVLYTGEYRLRVRGSFGGGLGPLIHITGPQKEVLVQLMGTYHDRHSRRRINEDNDVQPDPSMAFSSPKWARVGGDFRVRKRDASWVGFIFRSQVMFPVEQVDLSGRTLKEAWVFIREAYERYGRIGESCGNEPYPFPTARGGKVYGLTGPWSGACIETPGYEVGEIPSHVDSHTIDITDLVRGWLDGSKPNHGLIIGSRFEPFPEGACFLGLSWYEVILNMKFLEDTTN
jgi:hypothetical protein